MIELRTEGEEPLHAVYNLSMSRHDHTTESQLNKAEWGSVDRTHFLLDGHQLNWNSPPSNDSLFDMSAASQRYSAVKRFELRVDLKCHNNAECIIDGQTVKTVFRMSAMNRLVSDLEVRVTTTVEALASCENSRAFVERVDAGLRSRIALGTLMSLSTSSSYKALVHAVDVDGFPMNFTRLPVLFRRQCTGRTDDEPLASSGLPVHMAPWESKTGH